MLCACATVCAGCGTTRRTDTTRTATEQLLLSDAIDRSISRIDFGLLAGKDVYMDSTYLANAVDKEYIISTLRQHMLACGCILKDKKEEASMVVEVRAGTVGTDRHDLLFGTPATTVSLGALSPVPGTPTMVPEIALAKRTDQMGVAKIAVFAYERSTGVPVWQSGSDVVASRARDLWVFGAGPFQRGNIYGGTKFAGEDLRVPLVSSMRNDQRPPVRVARERLFNPQVLAKSGESGSEKKDEATGLAKAGTPAGGADAKSLFAAPQPAMAGNQNATQSAAASVAHSATVAPADGAPPRSQFDSSWSTTPNEASASTAAAPDRHWPPTSSRR
jgi:uncharacterized protein DUF6655